MKAQDLKKSILQYAMQGKLVAQDPNDESASELLKRIKAEKEQLIKDGKIKKEKPLPPITQDEIPYDLPPGWEWVRLGNICSLNPRNIADDDINAGFIPMSHIKDGYNNEHFFEIKKWKDIKKGFTHFKNGDIVIAKITPCFQNRKSAIIKNLPNNIGAGTTELHVIREDTNILLKKYLLSIFKTELFIKNGIKNFTGTAGQQRIGKDYLANYLIPLPPLAEQKRIVEKLEEILPLVDEYGKNEEILSEMNQKLPKQIRQSILQYAVQGKLVEQNPQDEPASELLKRIKAEKEQLIKEGKIKKEKPLPPITQDEIPYDLPPGWEWVRLGNICSLNPRNIADDDINAGFIPMSHIKDGYNNEHFFEIKKWKDIKKGFTHFKNGDIVIAKITPCFQNRKSAIIKNLPNNIGAGTTELHVIREDTNILLKKYLLSIFKTELFIKNGIKNFTGTAGQQRIGKDYLANYLIPLPPLAEQKRIVAKVEELLNLVNKLEVS